MAHICANAFLPLAVQVDFYSARGQLMRDAQFKCVMGISPAAVPAPGVLPRPCVARTATILKSGGGRGYEVLGAEEQFFSYG